MSNHSKSRRLGFPDLDEWNEMATAFGLPLAHRGDVLTAARWNAMLGAAGAERPPAEALEVVGWEVLRLRQYEDGEGDEDDGPRCRPRRRTYLPRSPTSTSIPMTERVQTPPTCGDASQTNPNPVRSPKLTPAMPESDTP